MCVLSKVIMVSERLKDVFIEMDTSCDVITFMKVGLWSELSSRRRLFPLFNKIRLQRGIWRIQNGRQFGTGQRALLLVTEILIKTVLSKITFIIVKLDCKLHISKYHNKI